MSKKQLKKLNLGAGYDIREDCDNHDIISNPDLKYVFDLEDDIWPIDQKYDYIYLYDVIEHLQPKYFFRVFEKCWDLLNEGGIVDVRVPSQHSPATYTDPTHYRGYSKESFEYLDPDTNWGDNYGFYTNKKYKITEAVRQGPNLRIILRKRG